MCYPVYGMVHINFIAANWRVGHVVAAVDVLSS